jgi:hypothetical protein
MYDPLKSLLCGISGFSLLSLHLISLYGVHRWGDKKNILANIYCTVDPWI